MKYYDTIIIGAGVVGACVADALRRKKQTLMVLDTKGIAKGGSGGAGAFVSPKIGKASPFHGLTNEAFSYARGFYTTYTPTYFHQTGLEHISIARVHTLLVDNHIDVVGFSDVLIA